MSLNITSESCTEDVEIETLSEKQLRARWFLLRLNVSHYFPSANTTWTCRVGLNTHVKSGHTEWLLKEARAIQFVSSHTTIPVPRIRHIYRILPYSPNLHMIMDQAEGQPLERLWDSMSERLKSKVIGQLQGYITQLRSLVPPDPELVASSFGGPIYEPARLDTALHIGPFKDHDKFHTLLRDGHSTSALVNAGYKWAVPVAKAHSLKYASKFTHGDLAPRNIMCKRDGTVTCILDWESAGWYPEYWEYTKAHYAPRARESWVEKIGIITGEYPSQLQAERYLQANIYPRIIEEPQGDQSQ